MARPPLLAEGKLGIVAGGGTLPLHLIAACRAAGREFYVLALTDQADLTLTQGVPHDWNRLGAGGAGLEKLRDAGVKDVVFAGRVKRPSLVSIPKAISLRASVAAKPVLLTSLMGTIGADANR